MSRPSASHDLAAALADESDEHAKPSTSTSTSGRAPTAYDVSRRAVRATRTPVNVGLSSGAGTSTNPRRNPTPGGSRPNRSRTVPMPASPPDANPPAINTKTVGSGARRRAPTTPLPQSTRPRLDSTHSQRESPADADKSFLSIPDPQNRQSTASSFYTDPSSYYSAESNLSFLAGAGASPSDSGSSNAPNFRPPAMPTPPIPPVPTNLRMSTSTGNSMPEPSRQSTSDSAAYANYPPWLVNSVNAPPMPTLEQHPEATEESANEYEGDNAADEWDDDEDEEEQGNDGWQMPEPQHYPHHWSNPTGPGDEEESADGHGAEPPLMPEPEHQTAMPMPLPNTSLPHENVNDDGLDDMDSGIPMPSHPNDVPSHSPPSIPMPSTPSRLQTTLPLTTPSRPNQPPASPSNLSPTTRRPYGSNIMPPVVIPPPPKTPPPVPSPQKTNHPIGLAVGGLWDTPVGAHAHQQPVPPLPQHARPPSSEWPPTHATTSPLKIHHAKPSTSQKVDAPLGTSAISQAQGQAAIASAGGLGASGGRPGGTAVLSSASTPQKPPTKVTITSNSRIEHPAATSAAGTIPTPAHPSSRPNAHFGAAPATASATHQSYPPLHAQAQTQSQSQANAGGGRLSISGPQPMRVSTSSGSQGRPYTEKVSVAPSSSGHAETMQTSSTAALAATGGGGGGGGASSNPTHQPTRPNLTHGTPSQMDTQYVNMLLALDDIPTTHNLAASFFNWILLAGFILFPGTFTSLKNESASNGGQVPDGVVNAVTQLPLFVVAWVCCAIGAAGMVWLWWRWHKNYIWALNKVFAPALLNSLAGLLSTIASIFGAQHGQLSTTSKSTLIITTASSGVFLILTAVYSLWLVRRVKRRHDREVGLERAGRHGEGVVDVSKRRHRV